MLYQRTIAKEVSITGVGLHSGRKVTLNLKPGEVDSGIVFRRIDVKDAKEMRASALSVGATENATSLSDGKYSLHTVEHLLAVLYGMGIDNIYCEVNGPEVPIVDGSGAPFVFLLKETGIKSLSAEKKFLVILEPVEVRDGDKWAKIEPCSSLVIDSTIIFSHPKIKKQTEVFEFSCENFINEISRARTFGLLKDVDLLKKKGLAKGGSLDNAIVLDDYNVINSEGLRMANEFVKHKVLDTIGDLALLGNEIAGKVTTFKSGHNLHNMLCRKLLSTPSAFKIVSASSLQPRVQEAFSLPVNVQEQTV